MTPQAPTKRGVFYSYDDFKIVEELLGDIQKYGEPLDNDEINLLRKTKRIINNIELARLRRMQEGNGE